MLQRTSNVDQLNVMVLSYSSIIQLGDSCIVNGFSRAIAVQREAEIFYGNEGNFPTYTVFKKPIPLPPINEAISFIPHNPKPMIKVKKIDIIGISSSSILHVGNSRNISMEARVKHIRQELPFGHEQDMQ
ncbi:spore germination protein GerPE [Bacillus salipaludis]|uniref:spore germination protein GerPE n=1 Tax=Bacillus salipaludis TaxID=2547811 RepID=UPI002E1C4358|nr:spore germination protein GerPE [Bacillus salipaludis]